MTYERLGIVGAAVAILVAPAVAAAGQAEPRPQQPFIDTAKDSLAARLAPGLGFDLRVTGVSPAVLRKRLRLQVDDIGTVAEDPVTALRIVQRRQWQRDPGIMLIEHRIVNGGRQGVQIKSVAVADLVFRPLRRRPKSQPAGQALAPTVRMLGAGFLLHTRRVSADSPLAVESKGALPMLVLADERNASGIVLALAATTDPWLFRAVLSKAGRLHVRVEVGQADQVLTLEPGQTLRLPPLALAAYRGSWRQGAAKLRRFWASGFVDRSWEELRGHIGRRFRQATAKAAPLRTRLLLGRANFFVPASMLPCRIPTPSAKLPARHLQTTLRSYLSGAWKPEHLPDGLTGRVARALAAVADLHGQIAHLLDDLYLRLSPLATRSDQWDVRQFHSRQHDAGVVLLFRQQSPISQKVIRLRGLKPAATYHVWNTGAPKARLYRGKQLMAEGLKATLPPDGSRVIRYQVLRRAAPRQ